MTLLAKKDTKRNPRGVGIDIGKYLTTTTIAPI